jgi:hypothetical protein
MPGSQQDIRITMDGGFSQSDANPADGRAAGFDALSLHRRLASHRDSTHVAETPTVTGRCWCISKGMAGMNSQTAGLASAVGYQPLENAAADHVSTAAAYELINARMAFPWNCLPFSMIPQSGRVLKQPAALEASPQPRLVVSCGRHGVIPALYLKKKLGREVFTVHIQDPKCDTSGFDMVLIPKHDPTRGPNVYLTMGALHKVTSEKLEAARSGSTCRSNAAAGFGAAGREERLLLVFAGRH